MDLSRLKDLRQDMEKCFRCSLCKMVPLPVAIDPDFSDACPASHLYHFHGYSGSGKQIMALSLLDGRIQPDQALAKTVFACTACGYCDVACKFIMDVERHSVNMALRELLVDQGLSPPEHKQAMENLKSKGHVTGEPKRSPGKWAEGLSLKIMPGNNADVLLLAGCVQRNDDPAASERRFKTGDPVRKLARLLIHAGVDLGILGDGEKCCGLPAYWMGYREDFSRMASENISLINSLGVKSVVVASGSCFGAIRSKYPEYASALNAETLHATELLARLIDQGRLKLTRKVQARVTYHDPCYLGRQSEPFVKWEGQEKTTLGVMTYKDPPKKLNRGVEGVYDAPRRILKAIPGLEFREMYRIREYSFCCGAGGGVPLAYPELARSAALHRLEEAESTGAEQLLTACALCESHFTNVQEETGKGIPVVDIIDLVYQAAGLGE